MAAAFDVFLRRSIPGEHETMVTFLDGRLHADSIERRPVELRELPAFTEAAATVTERKQADLDTEVGLIRYLAAPVGPPEATAVFVVAQFLEPQLAEVRASLRIAAVANLIVLGMASVLAYLAAGRLLRPVRAVTETATAISESDLTQRIPVEGDDEISELARTFNSMLDRLEEAFASQRRFFDDAGHELRTPITIVRGNLELLPSEPEARKRALRVVDDELERMSRLVQDLLTLAKSGRPDFVTLVEVDVQRVVVDAFERVSGLAPRQWLTRIGGRGDLRRRRGPPRPGPGAARHQRRRAHRARRHDRARLRRRRGDGPAVGGRHRDRHRGGGARAHLRSLRPGAVPAG
jgi:two-component system, OmpR family, sensor kinase